MGCQCFLGPAENDILVWDATCSDTYAPFNIWVAVTGAEAVAEKSEQHKISKYLHLDSTYLFIPVVIETSGIFGLQALKFIENLTPQNCYREANSKQYLPLTTNFDGHPEGEHSLSYHHYGAARRSFLTLL